MLTVDDLCWCRCYAKEGVKAASRPSYGAPLPLRSAPAGKACTCPRPRPRPSPPPLSHLPLSCLSPPIPSPGIRKDHTPSHVKAILKYSSYSIHFTVFLVQYFIVAKKVIE